MLEALKRHADRHGPEAIMETAIDHLGFEALCDLQRHLDGLVAYRPFARTPRLSVEVRVKRLLGEDE